MKRKINGNKGKTWVRNRQHVHARVEAMTSSEWEALIVKIKKAKAVVQELAPRAYERSRIDAMRYAESGDEAAGVAHMNGMLLLAEILERDRAISRVAHEPNDPPCQDA